MLLFREQAEGINRALAKLRAVVEGLILRPAGEMIEANAEMRRVLLHKYRGISGNYGNFLPNALILDSTTP